MSDHTDFIRIYGLESGEGEVFQGLGATPSTEDVSVDGGGEAPQTDWGNLPEDVVNQIDKYFVDLKTWLATKPFDPSQSRGLTDALKPVVPVIVGAVVTAASGGTVAIPALASTLITQVGMNLVDGMLEQALERVDANPLQAAFETAFLTPDKQGSLLAGLSSLLQQALLEGDQSVIKLGLQQLTDILNQRLSDLAFVDAMIDFGFCRVHVKGKMIEY